jgi:hypothetical protein
MVRLQSADALFDSRLQNSEWRVRSEQLFLFKTDSRSLS